MEAGLRKQNHRLKDAQQDSYEKYGSGAARQRAPKQKSREGAKRHKLQQIGSSAPPAYERKLAENMKQCMERGQTRKHQERPHPEDTKRRKRQQTERCDPSADGCELAVNMK